MEVAYIAGPYRASTPWKTGENIHAARRAALKYSKLGYAVICPHSNTAHMDGEMPDQFWLDATMEMMRRCDLLVMIDGWQNSQGAVQEHDEALSMGMRIIYDIDESAA